MKRYICYIEGQGFAICDSNGTFMRATLEVFEASDNVDKSVWEVWIKERRPMKCYIFEK